MPSKKRGSDNSSNRSSRPSSSKSTAAGRQDEQHSEENSRDTNAGDSNVGTGADAPAEYKLNSRVLCQHTDSFFYDAKIINVQAGESGEVLYTIHYQGWNSRYDEILTHAEAINKFKQYTDENVKIANKEINDAKSRKRPRNSTKNKKEKNPAVPAKKHRSATPKTNTSARNTPIDFGELKPPTKPGNLASVVSDAPVPIPSRLHKKKVDIELPAALLDVLIKDGEMVQKQAKLVKLPANITIDMIVKDYESAQRNPYSNVPHADSFLRSNLDALQKTFSQLLSRQLIFKYEISQFLEMLNRKRNDLGYTAITLAQYSSAIGGDDDENADAKNESTESKDEPVTMRETRSKRQSKVSDKRASTKKELNSGSLKDEDIAFSTVYGFIHFLRFLNHLIKEREMSVGMYNFYAPLISDLLEFLSSKKNDYYKQEADYEAPPKSYKVIH